jgi:hypothetical protein
VAIKSDVVTSVNGCKGVVPTARARRVPMARQAGVTSRALTACAVGARIILLTQFVSHLSKSEPHVGDDPER